MSVDKKTKTVRLGDIAEVIPGYAFKSTDFVETKGVPVIKIKNITNDYRVSIDDVIYIPESLLTKKLEKFIVIKDDFLVAMTGATAGKMGRVFPKTKAVLNQRVAKIQPKNIDKEYLWSLLAREDFTQKLYKLADGAAQPNMSGSQIENVLLEILPPETQAKIGAILSSLNQKIELNRKMNKTLEEMGQALFKHYFIDNPDAKGWEKKSIKEFATIQYGYAFKSNLFNENAEGQKIIRIRNIRDGDSGSYTTEQADSSYLVKNGDVLVGMDGDFHINYWGGGDAYLVQRVARFRAKESYSNVFVKNILMDPIAIFDKREARTTVAHLSAKEINEISLPFDVGVYDNLSGSFEYIFKNHFLLNREIRILTNMRDSLLPRLMSGKIQV
ncbi:restriction endonuclease subunit S [Patescibacteria group bacterium]|nr:restriction endonuclease subunit S [Patescibacteria group bacterium]